MLGVTASQPLVGIWDRPGSYHAAAQVNVAKPSSPSTVHRRMPRSATCAKNHRTLTSSTPRSRVARRVIEGTSQEAHRQEPGALRVLDAELVQGSQWFGLVPVVGPLPSFHWRYRRVGGGVR